MAQSHTFFATNQDIASIIKWLIDAGAKPVGCEFPVDYYPPDGREYVFHFPSIGPLSFWPDEINLADYPENSNFWRKAVLTKNRQQESPETRQVNVDQSAIAGIKLPELRDGRYWVSACVWFPGSRLRDTFPELLKICQRFERMIRKFPTVFDNTKGEDKHPFNYQLCDAGIIQRIVALPEAYMLLEDGAFMVDHMTSPRIYQDFRRMLQLRGDENDL